MNRQEFVERLRAALSGRMPSAMVADNVNYYEDYINVEIRKGRTEEEVLTMLGDPRLIAKTIIQANVGAGDIYNTADSYTAGDVYSSADSGYRAGGAYSGAENGYAADSIYRNGSAYDEDNGFNQHIFRIPGWLAIIVVILVTLLIVSAIVSVLSFLAPLILAMAVVLLMVKVFDWLN